MENRIDPVLVNAEQINRKHRAYIVHQLLLQSLATAVKKYARGRVLDIGCGNKPYQSLFTQHTAVTSYTGCDMHQTALNTVDIVCAAEAIPLDDQSIDTVFCTQVVEHSFTYKKILAEAHRLLVPDGTLILSAPLYWPVHGEPHDFFRFTKFGLEKILAEAGFEVLEIRENGGHWAVAGQSLIHAVDFSRRRSVFLRLLRFLFFRAGFLQLTNRIFSRLDAKDPGDMNTLNYVVIAKKSNKP